MSFLISNWCLIIVLSFTIPGLKLPPNVTMTTVPGFQTKEACEEASKEVKKDFGPLAQTSCVFNRWNSDSAK